MRFITKTEFSVDGKIGFYMKFHIQILINLFILTLFSLQPNADNNCQEWFNPLKIHPAQSNCFELCINAPIDLGTFTCHDECENLCQILRSKIPNKCKIPQTELKCDFYDQCLEDIFQCGDGGYPQSYGKKYCERFLSLKKSEQSSDYGLSSKGIKWRDETLLCLQNVLAYDFARRDYPLTCDSIKQEAFDSHVDCYTKYGSTSICSLPAKDIGVVFILPDLKDLSNFRAVKQTLFTGAQCLTDWFLGKRNILNITNWSYDVLSLKTLSNHNAFKSTFLEIKKSIASSNLESKKELIELSDQIDDIYSQILFIAASNNPNKKQQIQELISKFKSTSEEMILILSESKNE